MTSGGVSSIGCQANRTIRTGVRPITACSHNRNQIPITQPCGIIDNTLGRWQSLQHENRIHAPRAPSARRRRFCGAAHLAGTGARAWPRARIQVMLQLTSLYFSRRQRCAATTAKQNGIHETASGNKTTCLLKRHSTLSPYSLAESGYNSAAALPGTNGSGYLPKQLRSIANT